VIVTNDSRIFLNKSTEDERVIKLIAEQLSKKEIDAWAFRAGHRKEIVQHIVTRKATANIPESQTDYYRKCDWILYVHHDDPRVKPILDWMHEDWTEENDYKGFIKLTPMSKKIHFFCQEGSHFWKEISESPHARVIEVPFPCKLTPDEKEHYLNIWCGGIKARMGIMRKLMAIFDKDFEDKKDVPSKITKDAE